MYSTAAERSDACAPRIPTGRCVASTSATISASPSSASRRPVRGPGHAVFVAYNGVACGSVAGLPRRARAVVTFFPFVATHSAFELTAIVLSGAAGLRIGQALIGARPRAATARATCTRPRRRPSSFTVSWRARRRGRVEAFWSSARWMPPAVKFTAAPHRWAAVILISLYRAAMQIEALACASGRGPLEAADLGVRMCQRGT